jgi:hypothetical protein
MWQAMKDWIEEPFRQPVSLWDVFLLTGLILIFMGLWSRVMFRLSAEI